LEKRETNEHELIPPAFFALPFENELDYHYLCMHINSSNDQATSHINFVGFWPYFQSSHECTTGANQLSGKYIYVRQVMFHYYMLRGNTSAPSGLCARRWHKI